MRLFIGTLGCICLFLLATVNQSSAAVYLTPKEVLAEFFKDSELVTSIEKELSDKDKDVLKQQLGYRLNRDRVIFYVGKTGDQVNGYALLDHQIGKTQPITFMTLINPQGRVEQIEVLVYRESHGSEVRHQRFLKQFYELGPEAQLKAGQDIVNISGATLSVNAITVGVKRALVLWNYYYGAKPPSP